MNMKQYQTFQAKNPPVADPVTTYLTRSNYTDIAPPRLIVTRAILNARNVQRRIQACTPTLMSSPYLNGGENV